MYWYIESAYFQISIYGFVPAAQESANDSSFKADDVVEDERQ